MEILKLFLCLPLYLTLFICTELNSQSFFDPDCGYDTTVDLWCSQGAETFPIEVWDIGEMGDVENIGLIGVYIGFYGLPGYVEGFPSTFGIESPSGEEFYLATDMYDAFPDWDNELAYVTFRPNYDLPFTADFGSDLNDIECQPDEDFTELFNNNEDADGSWIFSACTEGSLEIICVRLDFGTICPEIVDYILDDASCLTTNDGYIAVEFIESDLCDDVEFSLDNTNWQSSSEFVDLAIGTYTLYVRNDPSCNDLIVCDGQALTFEIVNQDFISPELYNCPSGSQTVSTETDACLAEINLTDPDYFDNCEIITAELTIEDIFGYEITYAIDPGSTFTYTLSLGTSHFEWYVEDESGNSTYCTHAVTVEDQIAPEWIANLVTMNGECGIDNIETIRNLAESSFEYQDACLSPITLQLTSNSPTETTICGESKTYEYSYELSDAEGNVNPGLGYIIIEMEDTSEPVLTGIPNNLTVNCDEAFPDLPIPGVDIFADDACQGDISSDIEISMTSQEYDCSQSGNIVEVFTILIECEDACQNSVFDSYTITVTDTEGPVWDEPYNENITIIGECGVDALFNLINENIPTASGCSGEAEVIQTDLTFLADCQSGNAGETIIIYTATDICGNENTVEISFVLEDNNAPFISGIQDDVTINCRDAFPTIPEIKAEDWCDGDITDKLNITIDIEVNDNCVLNESSEIHTYQWSVEDGCGNENEYEWVVTIINDFAIDLGEDIESCQGETVVLNAGTGGEKYLWSTGETTQTINVTSSGDYNVIVTSLNNCCSEDQIIVNFNSVPQANAIGGTINCQDTSIVMQGMSSLPGTYAWTGPNNFTSNTQNPIVSSPGTYMLTVTSNQGCTNSAVTNVLENIHTPVISTNNTNINCSNPIATITALVDSAGVSYKWSGPNNYSSTDSTNQVNFGGQFIVEVMDTNSFCIALDTLTVQTDLASPNLSVYPTDQLTCNITETALFAISTTPGVNFTWTGPNNFTATTDETTTDTAGSYTVVATAPNGCVSQETIIVEQDIEEPNLTASGGIISCSSATTSLTANSTTANVSYSWTGPGSFNSTEQNPTVSELGNYTVTTTATNGCMSEQTVEVTADMETPTISAIGDTLTCTQTSVTLAANSTTPNISFLWTGPNGFSSSDATITVNIPGSYTVVGTAPNGCSVSTSAEAIDDTTSPETTIVADQITCTNPIAIVSASANGNNNFSWTGPNNFTANTANIEVEISGTYTVTTTGANGCSSSETINVEEDTEQPGAYALGFVITCLDESPVVMASSNMDNVSYSWTGPNNFSSNEANPSVEAPGLYTVVVTGSNGCTSADTSEVILANEAPEIQTANAIINCQETEVELTVNTTADDLNFLWSGPNGFTSTEQTITVGTAGNYTVTATSPNACTSTVTAVVSNDSDAPETTISAEEITCDNPIALVAVSAQGNNNFVWTGPNNFSATTSEIRVSTAGTYNVITTAENGCTTSESIEVIANNTFPEVEVDIDFFIDCTELAASFELILLEEGIDLNWTGPNGFESKDTTIVIFEVGEYELLLTAENGCTYSETVSLDEEIVLPNLTVSDAELNCNQSSIKLPASSNTDNLLVMWTGPNNFVSTELNPIVSTAGEYEITVTNLIGCTSIAKVIITENLQIPVVSIQGDALITCESNTATLNGISDDAIEYEWTGPNGFSSSEESISIGIEGEYSLIVTGNNGCQNIALFEVEADEDLPVLTVSNQIFPCDKDEITLDASSNSSNDSFTWTGPDNFNSSEQNPSITEIGEYTVTVISENGCSATQSIDIVAPDDIIAEVSTNPDTGTNNGSAAINISQGTGPFIILWPNGSNEMSVDNLSSGTYEVMITDAYGCTYEFSFIVDFISSNENLDHIIAGKIYPNPAINMLYIEYEFKNQINIQIELLSSDGKIVYKHSLESVEDIKMPIDLSTFNEGIYLLRMNSDLFQYVQPVIIMK